MPKISVVMSVYNCEKYVSETIQSVIDQTFSDWEFIIINDNSKDDSADVIRSFDDERIVFIDNKDNKGQCANLNYGISLARGKYIARLDHDDVCHMDRFEKQFKYMEDHPEIDLLGSKMNSLINGKVLASDEVEFLDSQEFKFAHTFFNYSLGHSSFFIRRSSLTKFRIEYDQEYKFCEDYRMILQFLNRGRVFCLSEALTDYRIFPEQTTQTIGNAIIKDEKLKCRKEFLEGVSEGQTLYSGVEGSLESMSDYSVFHKNIRLYAKTCGLASNNSIINKVERDVFWEQKRTPLNLLYILLTYL